MNEILEEKGLPFDNLFLKLIILSIFIFMANEIYSTFHDGILLGIVVFIMVSIFCTPLIIILVLMIRSEYYILILDDKTLTAKIRFFKDLVIPLENIDIISKEINRSYVSYSYLVRYNKRLTIYLNSAYYHFPPKDFDPFIEELKRRVEIAKQNSKHEDN